MPLSAGNRLSPYEIVSAIGVGGMGEVYRARDTVRAAAELAGGDQDEEVARIVKPGSTSSCAIRSLPSLGT
jgi:serine/threonine protein kinase